MVAEVSHAELAPAPEAVLDALPDPVLVVDAGGIVRYANPAAEQFFDTGAAVLSGTELDEIIAADSPLMALVRQVRDSGIAVHEYGAELGTARTGVRSLNIQVAPLGRVPGRVVVTFQEFTIAAKLDHRLSHRAAARSVTGMAAMLAHEVKNPLSGIRGAAQLLEQNALGEDRELTRLIRDEADRIVGLVDRMELFSDQRPIERAPVNIHEVLEHVRRIAQAGFARRLAFRETYDPSLPPIFGNRDQLVQAFLNLAKNAAEAASESGGEIVFGTAYRHGLRLALPGSGGNRLHLPLEVTVWDNGAGVPEEILPHLFEAFVTTKSNGTGLGLSLVAKIIGDHGGVIECESARRRTVFRVRLPILPGSGDGHP